MQKPLVSIWFRINPNSSSDIIYPKILYLCHTHQISIFDWPGILQLSYLQEASLIPLLLTLIMDTMHVPEQHWFNTPLRALLRVPDDDDCGDYMSSTKKLSGWLKRLKLRGRSVEMDN
jgi:hypothetical protein